MIKWFKKLWQDLGQSIYVGERFESNLNAITIVSILSAVLGIVMIAVNTGRADAYDAMRSDRIYRKGLSKEAIREELINGKGKQFDPDMLDVFVNLADEGELDIVTENANKQLSTAIELGLIEQQLSE